MGLSLLAALLAGCFFAIVSAQISPWVGLGALAGGVVCVAMAFSPAVAVMVVAISLPLERIGRLTEDFSTFTISLSRVVWLAALGGFLLRMLLKRWKPQFGAPFWLYAGYTAIALMSVTWAIAEKDAVRDSVRVLGNLIFFFLVVNMVNRFSLAKLGIYCWLAVSVGTGLYAMYTYHFSAGDSVEESEMGATSQRFTAVVSDAAESGTLGGKVKRVYGTTSHPGLFGLNLVMTLPFFAWAMRGKPVPTKLLLLIGLAIVCYCILLSNTRFVLVLAIITLALTAVRGLFELKPVTIAGLAVGVACVAPFIPEDVYLRTFDISLYSASKSDAIRIRFKMLDKSLDLLNEHWLKGIGIGNQTIIPEMITDELGGRITPDGLKASAHNEFVWSMVETGLFGWLFHWSFVAAIIATAFKAGRALRQWGRETQDQYWFMVAAQTLLVVVPFFGVQSEVFHYSLKGWWFAAGITWAMWLLVKRRLSGMPVDSELGVAA